MIRRFSACLLLTVFLASCGSPAVPSVNQEGSGSHMQESREQITTVTLPNGMKVHHFYHPYPADRVELRVVVHAGSANELPEQAGMAHFLEHMTFNGTASFKEGDIIREMQLLGSSFGSDVNAFTNFDATVYHLQVDTKPETVDKAMQILSELVSKPLFEPAEIEKERGVILAEKRESDGPWRKFWEMQFQVLFPGSSYGASVIGQEATINAFQQTDFQKFWETYYRPDNMELILVGDMKKTDLDAVIEKYFGAIPAATTALAPAVSAPAVAPQNAAWQEVVHQEVAEPAVNLIWLAGPHSANDEVARRAMLVELLNVSMLQRRLSRMVDDHSDIFTAAYAEQNMRMNAHHSMLSVSALLRETRYEEGTKLLAAEVHRFAEQGVSDDELAFAVSSIQGMYKDMLTNTSSRMSSMEADNIEDSVMYSDRIWTIDAQLEDQLAMMEALRPADLQTSMFAIRDAQGFLVRSPSMPADLKEKAQAQVTAALQAPLSPFTFQRPNLTLQSFPAISLPALEEIPALSLKRTILPNGVTLMGRQTTFDKDRFMLRLTVQGGPLIYPEDRKAMQAFQNMLNMASVQDLTRQDLQNLMMEKQIKVMAMPSDSSTMIMLDAPAERMDDVLQLAHDFMSELRYGERELGQLKEQLASMEKEMKTNPDAQMDEALQPMLWGNTAISSIFTEKEREDLTLERLQKVQAAALRSSQIEVMVFGSAEEQTMLQKAANVFGALPQQDAYTFDLTAQKQSLLPPSSREMKFGAEARSTVALRFPATNFDDPHEMAVYGLLGDILQTKLFDTLREEASGVYGAASTFRSDSARYYSYLMVNFQTDPVRTEELLGLFWKTVEAVAAEGITEADLLRARLPLIAGLTVGKNTNDYWFFMTGSRFFATPALDVLETMLTEVSKVTVTELTEALRTSVRKDKATQLIRYPAE